jgi:hypothetical protein
VWSRTERLEYGVGLLALRIELDARTRGGLGRASVVSTSRLTPTPRVRRGESKVNLESRRDRRIDRLELSDRIVPELLIRKTSSARDVVFHGAMDRAQIGVAKPELTGDLLVVASAEPGAPFLPERLGALYEPTKSLVHGWSRVTWSLGLVTPRLVQVTEPRPAALSHRALCRLKWGVARSHTPAIAMG